ncbi:lipoyl protein ligase domain-containing protein [Microbacterium invictum]|uniref:Lipoate-protein ligase A n=1 Tax=Microbacterium invictum TaxID=515415 RepID=A0AA40SP00_9MICO|nr:MULTISPECIES: lipoate--protein ligase family protein [Microbacterium]MBB4139745.1 lipoate-protein ligase A [Microbacterium invictum]
MAGVIRMPEHEPPDPFGHIASTMDRLRGAGVETRVLRIARPRPAMAFGRRDERMPGFARAAAAALQAGFTPAVRPVGGTFAPMHEGSLVVDEFGWSDRVEWPNERFDRHAALLAEVFLSYGIDARVGEVTGEYCPGAHSVNRAGVVKLSGTAQRVARGAWVVSSVVQVGPVDALLEATRQVAAELGRPVDIHTIGSLSDTVPGIDIRDVADRIAQRFAEDGVEDVSLLL